MTVKRDTLERARKIVAEFNPSAEDLTVGCGCSFCGLGCSGVIGMD